MYYNTRYNSLKLNSHYKQIKSLNNTKNNYFLF